VPTAVEKGTNCTPLSIKYCCGATEVGKLRLVNAIKIRLNDDF